MLAEALHKDTVFKVTLTVPRSFLSPRQTLNSEEINTSNEVAIRVLHKQRGTDSVWTTETLEEKVLVMREMYERLEEGGSPLVSRVAGGDAVFIHTHTLTHPHTTTHTHTHIQPLTHTHTHTHTHACAHANTHRMRHLDLIHFMTLNNTLCWVWLISSWTAFIMIFPMSTLHP